MSGSTGPARQGIWSRMTSSLRPEHDDDPLVGAAEELRIGAIMRRFWPRLRPLRWWLAASLLLLGAAPLITIIEVTLYQRLVDDVLVPADFSPLLVLALLYIGLNLLSGVIDGADDYLSTWISQRFLVPLRRDAFDHVLRLPTLSLDRRRLGDVLARLTSDIAAVERFMVDSLATGIGSVLTLLFYGAALFWMDWKLALASMVVIPLFWWISHRFGDYTRALSRERRRRGGSLTSVTEEMLANAALVQSYRREDRAVASYHRQNKAIAGAELAASRVRAVFTPMVDLAELVGVLVVVGLGVWSLSNGSLTLGGLLAFLTLLTRCYGPIRDLAGLLPDLYSAGAGAERVIELLDEAAVADRPGATRLPAGPGALAFRGVGYTYPEASRAAISDVHLEVAAGEHVAIVGPSGSGKSTLARMLTRQVSPATGTVTIDGHDLEQHTADSVRANVTTVLQEQHLLDASIHDNIAFARPDATEDDVRHAARLADATEFIERLPDGFDTRIGQRGRSLSGGQRQRIALARALLRDTPVLVLDEPTTGLDEPTTRRLLGTLTRSTHGRTVVVLTHDPVALEYVDRVIDLGAIARPAPTDDDAHGTVEHHPRGVLA